jgi:hypothetical protein
MLVIDDRESGNDVQESFYKNAAALQRRIRDSKDSDSG